MEEALFKNYEGFVDTSGLVGCCDQDCIKLLSNMLTNDPGDRKTASELLEFNIFKDREITEGSRLLSQRYKNNGYM